MKYPIAIEPGSDTEAYGVVVPDLPGCFSAGDTLEEAIDNAKEAIEAWLEVAIDDGGEIPAPSALAELSADKDYAGWIWAVVAVSLDALSDKAIRVNITLPARVLRRIDADAKRAGETRSGYIAHAAMTSRH